MRINVTETHIKNGKRKVFHACPIALAIKEACKPDYVKPKVALYPNPEITYLPVKELKEFNPQDIKTYVPSPDIIEIIRNYDNNNGMEPFEFELNDKHKGAYLLVD